MIGRRRRRIAAVVRGDDQQVSRPQRIEQVGQAAIEVLQAPVEVDGIVPMPPEHVGLDEVGEDKAVVDRAEQLLRLLDAFDVRLRGVLLVDVDVSEYVRDLPDSVDLVAHAAYLREVVRAAWLEREVVAVRGALVRPGLTAKRPRDHTTDRMLSGEDLSCDPAAGVELLEWNRLLVRGDLEDRVRARVDDPLAGALVLLAELLNDLRAARRPVSEHTATGSVHER